MGPPGLCRLAGREILNAAASKRWRNMHIRALRLLSVGLIFDYIDRALGERRQLQFRYAGGSKLVR